MENEKIALVYSFAEFSAIFPDILKSKHHMTRDCTLGKTVQVCYKSFSQFLGSGLSQPLWDISGILLCCASNVLGTTEFCSSAVSALIQDNDEYGLSEIKHLS